MVFCLVSPQIATSVSDDIANCLMLKSRQSFGLLFLSRSSFLCMGEYKAIVVSIKITLQSQRGWHLCINEFAGYKSQENSQ